MYSLRTKKAEDELQEAMERAQTLEDDLKAARNDRRQIADELEALRKRPVEVAVQRDEKAIREAAAKAKAEADASWEKKKRELDKQAETTQQELVRTRKEAELLKEQLAEAKKKMEAATGTGEKRQISDEIEALKRKLAMADTAVTAARGKKMGLTDGRMPTPESPEPLRWRTDRDFPDGPVLLLISENGSILYETDDVQGGKLGWFEEPDDGEILRWIPLPEAAEEGEKA